MPRITTAFIPVEDPKSSAAWYRDAFDLTIREADEASAVLGGDDGMAITLLGPASGIAQRPGIEWATCNLLVSDLDGTRESLRAAGMYISEISGDPDGCLFFTTRDPDRNMLLVTDR
ncbi:VOC family protein [Streptomyces sp. ISL-90]|nr:VOC family protein [Streptomyces sp. ISL-90]